MIAAVSLVVAAALAVGPTGAAPAQPEPQSALAGAEGAPERGLRGGSAGGGVIARYYDPRSSTWTSTEPLLVSSPDLARTEARLLNAYSYSFQNPVTLRDLDGRVVDGLLMQEKAVSEAGASIAEQHPTFAAVVGGSGLAVLVVPILIMIAPEIAVLVGSAGGGAVVAETALDVAQVPGAVADAVANPTPQSVGGAAATILDAATGLPTPAAELNTARRSTKGSRTHKVAPDPNAAGAHTAFKRDPRTGNVSGYTEFDAEGNPVKRFRAEGKSHGGVEPPLILERQRGKGPGAPLNRARPANADEIPKRNQE